MALRVFKKTRGGYAAPPPSPAARSLLPSFSTVALLQGGSQRHKDRVPGRVQNLSRTQPASTGHPEPQRRGNFSEARDVPGHSLLDDSDDDDNDVQEDDSDDDELAVPLEDSSSEEESMDELEGDLFRPWTSSSAASPGWTLPAYHGGFLHQEDVPSLSLQQKKYPVCRDDFSTDDDDDDLAEDSPEEEDLFSWATEEQPKQEAVEIAVSPELEVLLCSESGSGSGYLADHEEVAASPDIFAPVQYTRRSISLDDALPMDLLCSDNEDLGEDEDLAAICTALGDSPDSRAPNHCGRTEPLPTPGSPTPLVSPSHPGGSTAHSTPSVPSASVSRRQRAPKRILPTLTPFQKNLMDMSFKQNIYVGQRRHHVMARGMDLSADVIKEYFKRWRRNGFRRLHRVGLSDHVTKIRKMHRSTLPFYQQRRPSSMRASPSASPSALSTDASSTASPSASSTASAQSLTGPPPQVQSVHQVQPVHQLCMSQLELGELRDPALVIQPLASQPQVPEVVASSSGQSSVHRAPAGRHELAPYQFNRPWVYQVNGTQ